MQFPEPQCHPGVALGPENGYEHQIFLAQEAETLRILGEFVQIDEQAVCRYELVVDELALLFGSDRNAGSRYSSASCQSCSDSFLAPA